jgi:hypothetical protein
MKTEKKGPGTSVPVPDAFLEAHTALRKILDPFTKKKGMKLAKDGPRGCILLAPHSPKWPQYPDGVWFASTRIGKNYVSYYFMPIYMCDELQRTISPALKKRMQGKACFNFKAPDPELFKELSALTKAGYERWKRDGLV